ncbi:unnamed protein product [Adineta ricciae]|uniref:Arginine deiminase n=1 Tax=Adineta ricciae TaxID=249248 RepID=A0A815F6W9_ADIRI|nr:unnamed protein product [Adineta ricciae]CAF1357839.1 unnamed protein product [Adineta ricciae]
MLSISTSKHHRYPHHQKQSKQIVGVYSEVGKLDLVLMHRPGRELERLTHKNKDIFLFEKIPNIQETQKSHDIFTDILRKNGVTVVYVLDVLRETLEQSPEARQMLIDGVVQNQDLTKEASNALTQFLSKLTPTQLAHTVIEGLASTEEELVKEDTASILTRMCSSYEEFLVPPLPNLLFTRDSFSIIDKAVFIWRMAKSARANEPLIMRVIFSFNTHHAQLSLIGVRVIEWETYADPSATVEGGDVAYLGEGTLMIGSSERTNRAGIEAIARTG